MDKMLKTEKRPTFNSVLKF